MSDEDVGFELVRNVQNEDELDKGHGGDLADEIIAKKKPTMVHINF